jgi:hypothetical protein
MSWDRATGDRAIAPGGALLGVTHRAQGSFFGQTRMTEEDAIKCMAARAAAPRPASVSGLVAALAGLNFAAVEVVEGALWLGVGSPGEYARVGPMNEWDRLGELILDLGEAVTRVLLELTPTGDELLAELTTRAAESRSGEDADWRLEVTPELALARWGSCLRDKAQRVTSLIYRPDHEAATCELADLVLLCAQAVAWLDPRTMHGFDQHLLDYTAANGSQQRAPGTLPRAAGPGKDRLPARRAHVVTDLNRRRDMRPRAPAFRRYA